MAITMSDASVDTSERDSLLSSTVDMTMYAGGVQANVQSAGGVAGFFGATEASGATLAGVTPTFAANVSAKIDDYTSHVKSILDQLQDVNSEVAFKGAGIKEALTTFIDSVREVSQAYLNKLAAAEKQIVDSVDKSYQTQDSDLAGNLRSDSGSMTDIASSLGTGATGGSAPGGNTNL